MNDWAVELVMRIADEERAKRGEPRLVSVTSVSDKQRAIKENVTSNQEDKDE